LLLPVTVFWELSRNIDRIKAENDLRQQRVLSSIINDSSKLVEQLISERGEIADTTDTATGFDRSGFNKLKAMISRRT
jgi:hypothetical protein